MTERKVVLSYGIRKTPWRANPMKPLYDRLDAAGVPAVIPDLGYVLVPVTNGKAIRRVEEVFNDGDILVGFSNGCYANAQVVQRGAKPWAVINVSAALDRYWEYPQGLRVYNFYNPEDLVLTAGHAYSWIVSWMPWRLIKGADGDHGWGTAGRYGLHGPYINVKLPAHVGHSWYNDSGSVDRVFHLTETLHSNAPA